MFNSKEVARMVGVSDSTLRRYIKVFPQAFSKTATRKRGRRYSEQDLSTVARIQEMFAQGHAETDIRNALENVIFDEAETPPLQDLAIIPKMDRAIQEISKSVRDYDNRLSSHDTRLSETERRLNAWQQYQKELAAWEALGFWEKRRTPKPRPPE